MANVSKKTLESPVEVLNLIDNKRTIDNLQ